jgi:hypothetical protein
MKRISLFSFVVLAALLTSCDKGKFETKPLIEVKDYSSKEIQRNGELILRLNYYDKEGDLGEGTFYLIRNRLNLLPPTPGENRADILTYTLPKFENKDEGEIRIILRENDFLGESSTENDTMQFRIAVTDKEGNASDTITTDNIVVIVP